MARYYARVSSEQIKAPEIPSEGRDRAAPTKATGAALAIPRITRSMPTGISPDAGRGSTAGGRIPSKKVNVPETRIPQAQFTAEIVTICPSRLGLNPGRAVRTAPGGAVLSG